MISFHLGVGDGFGVLTRRRIAASDTRAKVEALREMRACAATDKTECSERMRKARNFAVRWQRAADGSVAQLDSGLARQLMAYRSHCCATFVRSGIVIVMNDGQFTARAAVLWAAIPKETRARIVANAFCVKCCGAVEIVNFTGEETNGDLILKGACAKCGHEVARLVETSESDKSVN